MYQGRCSCGSIRYESNAESPMSFQCQCRQCQRITGTGHASQFMLSAGEVSITGEIKFYDSVVESGNTVSSGFCPICGSPILKKTTRMPNALFFHAGTLDDPNQFSPQNAFWTQEGPEWDLINPALVDAAQQ